VSSPPTYRALAAVPGFRRLGGATLVARTGTTMQSLVLVLFVLQRFHSPPLAGLVVFLSLVPGIIISPLAGALLDRHRRMLLINLDYAIAALALATIAALDASGHLSATALLVIVGVGSLTNPLSNSGTRSLFPMMVPRPLWERANAVDSGFYVVAAVAGPAAAGVLISVTGTEVALLATAALFVVGVLLLVGMPEPEVERMPATSLFGDALAGLRYVVSHRELRGLAVTTAVANVAFGIVNVAMPVLLLARFGAGSATVGAMWAVLGVAGLVAGLVAGRFDSEGREVWFILIGCCLCAVSLGGLLLASSLGGGVMVVAVAMACFGIGNGPYDIGLFSLRQRVTAPAWMGRAFAVSMSLNVVGVPIGSVMAGPIVEHSLPVAFAVGMLVDVAAGAAALLMLRPRHADPAGGPGGRRRPTRRRRARRRGSSVVAE
jgi:MFS family permease